VDADLTTWRNEVAALFEQHARETAAVILELVLQGAGAMYIYPSARSGSSPAWPRHPGHTLDERIGEFLISQLNPLAAEAALGVSAELEQCAAEADALRAATSNAPATTPASPAGHAA
jgi:hypothetical protein